MQWDATYGIDWHQLRLISAALRRLRTATSLSSLSLLHNLLSQLSLLPRTGKSCNGYLDMDSTLNPPNGADSQFLDGDRYANNITAHGPSSTFSRGATGGGTSSRPESAYFWADQPLDLSQIGLAWAQNPPESSSWPATQTAPGFGSHTQLGTQGASLFGSQSSPQWGSQRGTQWGSGLGSPWGSPWGSDSDSPPQDSNSNPLTRLLEYLSKRGSRKPFSKTTRAKVLKILKGHPDIDVNELVNGEAILHDVCRHSYVPLLTALLERSNINVNVKTHNGSSGLHIACEKVNVDVLDLLLQSPQINVNIRDSSKSWTPLHIAVTQGTQSLMERLLTMAEIDIQAEDVDGYLPVHYAAKRPMRKEKKKSSSQPVGDCRDVLFRLCGNGAVNARTPQGRGPLHLAAEAGNIPAVEIFLAQSDLDINMKDEHGDTALHLARDEETIGELLDKGLDVHIQNVDGDTALHCALGQPQTGLVDILLKNTKLDADLANNEGQQLMHIASIRDNIEVFKQLAATPPSGNINMQDKWGKTVLHLAAQVNNTKVVEHLLNIPSVDVNARDEELRMPLHLACEQGHIDTVRLLLKHDDIHAEYSDREGRMPLHLAIRSGIDEKIVCELLPFISNIDYQVPASGATALHLAAHVGRMKTVWNILEKGANPLLTCKGLVSPDSDTELDAAGVASKIEIADMIRRYRGQKIPFLPDRPSRSQQELLRKHENGSVYCVWEWPRAETLLDEHGNSPGPQRQRFFSDFSSVCKIYDRLASVFEEGIQPYKEDQWQLRGNSCRQKGWHLPQLGNKQHDSPWGTLIEKERATKWVHFATQNVSDPNSKPRQS